MKWVRFAYDLAVDRGLGESYQIPSTGDEFIGRVRGQVPGLDNHLNSVTGLPVEVSLFT